VPDSTDKVLNRIRRLARQLPPPLRQAAATQARRLGLVPRARRPKAPAVPPAELPELSVVVVARDAEQSLAGCLDSLRQQTLRQIEVIIVDDRSTDQTVEVARAVAAEDERVRLVEHTHAGLAAARNAGAGLARGEFLTFLNASDTVPPTAYAGLVGSLRRTGSDFAAGGVRELEMGKARRPPWVQLTHDLDRPAQTLTDFPIALQDTAATNKVFRRSFWTERVDGFPEGSDHSETFAIVGATLRAEQFDFLQMVSCIRGNQTGNRGSRTARPDVDELDARLRWLETTWQLVHDNTDPETSGAWLGGLIDGELGDLSDAAQGAGTAYWDRLRASAERCLTAADANVWPHVRLDRKLRLWYAAHGEWAELERSIHHVQHYSNLPPTRVVDGRILARPSSLPDSDGLPPDLLELSAGQTALTAGIQRVSWTGPLLTIDGWAGIGGLDLTGIVPELNARLIRIDTGEQVDCLVQQVLRAEANEWARFSHADLASGGFTITVDTATIDDRPGRWQLWLAVRAHGVERSGPVQVVVPGGVGRRLPSRELSGVDDPVRVVAKLDAEFGFCVQVRPELIRAVELVAERDTIRGRLRTLDPSEPPPVSVLASSTAGRLSAEVVETDDPVGWTFALTLPSASEAIDWQFRVVDGRGRKLRVSWPFDSDRGGRVGRGPGPTWHRSPRGHCDLMTGWRAAEAVSVAATDDRLIIEVDLIGAGIDRPTDAVLAGRRIRVVADDLEQLDAERVRLSFPLRASQWDGPVLPLPTGDYQITVAGIPVTCGQTLIAELPTLGLTANHAFWVGRSSAGADLQVTLSGPKETHGRGRVARVRLAEWYASTEFTPTESVLFECYRGDFATDSQLEIHRELQRRDTGLELLWGVRDLSVPVPEGGRPLIVESRAWFSALGSSRYLCRNIDVERYFRKRSYQRYLQTFHGYPFKSMGASLWRANGRGESVIELESVRRSSAWDAILVPAEFCVQYYRQEYGFTGEALITGYPRNDPLVSADRVAVRSRVLRTLGIDQDTAVVLYAPTWRDTVATSSWSARMFDELDLAALAEQLGDGFSLLVRGHHYNLREGLPDLASRVLDVSAYPEVNDLILAADVAVLDYSSIRFDWLITEKPVLFFVPDLEDYLQSRTVLFDFAPTAPGPLLRTTAEVGAALLGLDTVAAEYAAARTLFNQRYNRLHDGHATERVIDAFFD
jgi:CDP-glycerol glycerophosphotransferase